MARPTIAGLTRDLKAYREEVSQLREGRRLVSVLLGIPAHSDHDQIRDAIRRMKSEEDQNAVERLILKSSEEVMHRKEVSLLRDELARLWHIVTSVLGVESQQVGDAVGVDPLRSEAHNFVDPNWR